MKYGNHKRIQESKNSALKSLGTSLRRIVRVFAQSWDRGGASVDALYSYKNESPHCEKDLESVDRFGGRIHTSLSVYGARRKAS